MKIEHEADDIYVLRISGILKQSEFSTEQSALARKSGEFSQTRDLPPLKLAAADLDLILKKTQAFIASANGSASDHESARESVFQIAKLSRATKIS